MVNVQQGQEVTGSIDDGFCLSKAEIALGPRWRVAH